MNLWGRLFVLPIILLVWALHGMFASLPEDMALNTTNKNVASRASLSTFAAPTQSTLVAKEKEPSQPKNEVEIESKPSQTSTLPIISPKKKKRIARVPPMAQMKYRRFAQICASNVFGFMECRVVRR